MILENLSKVLILTSGVSICLPVTMRKSKILPSRLDQRRSMLVAGAAAGIRSVVTASSSDENADRRRILTLKQSRTAGETPKTARTYQNFIIFQFCHQIAFLKNFNQVHGGIFYILYFYEIEIQFIEFSFFRIANRISLQRNWFPIEPPRNQQRSISAHLSFISDCKQAKCQLEVDSIQ